jgi:uncharacterized FlaG/YvyC family protein
MMIAIQNVASLNLAAAAPVTQDASTREAQPATPQTAASTEVFISENAQMSQKSQSTSVQFDTDPRTGTSVIQVISQNDHHVIRSIHSPVKMPSVSYQVEPVTPHVLDTNI